MTEKTSGGASATSRVLTALRELIRALDRRVPHIERTGETRIARDAQLLRTQAVDRIDELERGDSREERYDQDLVDSIMTDDGGPSVERRSSTRPSGTGQRRTAVARIDPAADTPGVGPGEPLGS